MNIKFWGFLLLSLYVHDLYAMHGLSPYAYCAGNPVIMIDPDGRAAVNGHAAIYSYYSNKPDNEELAYDTDLAIAHQIIEMAGYEKDKAFHYLGHTLTTGKGTEERAYAIDYKGRKIQSTKELHSLIVDQKRQSNDASEYTCVVFHSCLSGKDLGSPAFSYSIDYPDEYVVAPNNVVSSGLTYKDACSFNQGYEFVAGADGAWLIIKGGEVIGQFDGKTTPLYNVIVNEIKKYERKDGE